MVIMDTCTSLMDCCCDLYHGERFMLTPIVKRHYCDTDMVTIGTTVKVKVKFGLSSGYVISAQKLMKCMTT